MGIQLPSVLELTERRGPTIVNSNSYYQPPEFHLSTTHSHEPKVCHREYLTALESK